MPVRNYGVHILVAEDEESISQFIGQRLLAEGYTVKTVSDGEFALESLTKNEFDLAILDVMMPRRDGLSVVEELRRTANDIPVLLLSEKSATQSRIEGLNIGADDYLAKPFSMDELLARVQALLRRHIGHGSPVFKVGDLILETATRKVFRGKRRIDLTPREFAMLECLMRTPGHIFSRTELCEKGWEYHFDPGTNLVDVCIKRIRQKINDTETQHLIKTVRGIGYTIHGAR